MLKVVQYQQCTLSVEVTYDLVRIDLTRACAGGHPFSDQGLSSQTHHLPGHVHCTPSAPEAKPS